MTAKQKVNKIIELMNKSRGKKDWEKSFIKKVKEVVND